MSDNFSDKRNSNSLKGKIVIACLLACVAVGLSLYISRYTFGKILSTVDHLAQPNDRLELVDNLFKDVVVLDQLQRRQVLETKGANYNPLLKESQRLQLVLDSLRDMSRQNPTQVARIDSMKKILYERDLLFLRYFKLRTDLIKNDKLAGEVGKLSDLIEEARHHIDKNRVTVQRATKTTIDTIEDEEKKSLWNRVFAKKKPKKVQTKVEEELNVHMDTVQLGNRGDSLAKISNSISRMENHTQNQRMQLQQWQAGLNVASGKMIDQLISILNDIENEEMLHDSQQNTIANQLVRNGITNITIILIVLIVATIVLAYRIFSDIAQSNIYRRELIIAKEAAEAAGLVKQRFLANMSHELRTPLQTIVGVAEQIRTVQQPPAQAVENIYQSSQHLLQIVNEVLDYSRIISGKYTLHEQPFNMHNLLADVRHMIGVQAAAKYLQLVYEVEVDEDAAYMGDAFRLKQMLLNLLGNAVKFTDRGTVTLRVTQQPGDANTHLFAFAVSDTGIGMKQQDLALIFKEFEQAGNASSRQGTGLGLSIVHTMVGMLNGAITVESEEGKGTTFTMTLPYVQTLAPVAETLLVADNNHHTGHVWVVDDDKFILQLCDTILTKYNIAHTCFASALQAWQTPLPADISTVFLDVRMTEMSGTELCLALRKSTNGGLPDYVALTAHAFADEQQSILRQGFDRLVVKPFMEQQFMQALKSENNGAPTSAPALVIDLSTIIKMTGRDEELVRLSLQSFIDESEPDLANARVSLQQHNSLALADHLHKLAGRVGILGLQPLYNKLRSLEQTLRIDDMRTNAEVAMADICTDMEAVTDTIKGLLGRDNFLQSVGKSNTYPVIYS